ncbi:MAG: hypothetical protein HC849_04215 [Oscillatoriales cyanobacterium RU_3_3]|nr:hypothetical protein [Oscillatoriales cyanobacterium RU_3_3]
MLQFSIGLQTAEYSLAVKLSEAVPAALDSATKFLGDVGCFVSQPAIHR